MTTYKYTTTCLAFQLDEKNIEDCKTWPDWMLKQKERWEYRKHVRNPLKTYYRLGIDCDDPCDYDWSYMKIGDWIVYMNGELSVFSNEEFQKNFCEVKDL